MKAILILFFTLLSWDILAKDTYLCKEVNGKDNQERIVLLTQKSHVQLREGRAYRFKLEVFSDYYDCFPSVQTTAVVQVEDVMFRFAAKAEKISGMIYLDELHESWMVLDGERVDLDCSQI